MVENISVLIMNQSIDSPGILTNAAFVLGLTAGRKMPEDTYGPEVVDGDGNHHAYLTQIGHYVRKASAGKIKALRDTFASMPGVLIVDYTEDAAPADYSAYTAALLSHSGDEIIYRALHVYGPSAAIIPLTKNLSRL